MQKKPKIKYTKEFKERAVQLSFESEKKVREVAKELGISVSTLVDWRGKFGVSNPRSSGTTIRELQKQLEEQQRENQLLRKEKKIAEMERDILKKATVFFAKENG